MSIFITIVAYRDPWLWRTVDDLVRNAREPDALRFGIVDQSPEAADLTAHPQAAQMRYLHLHHRFGRGPCWARAVAQTFLGDEAFILQIDSHTVFDEGWDLALKQTLHSLQTPNPKVLITTYPASFEDTPVGVKKTHFPGKALVLRPRKDAAMTEQDPAIAFEAAGVDTDRPLPGCHVAGGFMFAPAALYREVPYDPALYFLGEEQSFAARAWTRGWDIFQMPEAPVYHLYHRSAEVPRPLHWDTTEDAERPQKWWQLQEASRARLRALLYERADLGVFGLGRERSLDEFAAFSGIDYAARLIRRDVT